MLELEHSKANRVFYHFEKICGIPHGSGNTKAVSDYCAAFAREHRLEYYQDKLNNVIIIREAAKGYETQQPVIIQGHLDMVCEKESDCGIDFETEGLSLYVEDGYLKARGTTLGADDGIAIAYALALLEKEDLKSPRLEAVFTVDEETGMYGAKGIDLTPLKGKNMLNLDSEEEGIFLCGCAGGMHSEAVFDVKREQKSGTECLLKVTGLEGGHSGTEIGKGHGNAIQILGRVLKEFALEADYDVICINGGMKENAIPREACASILIAKDTVSCFNDKLKELEDILRMECRRSDPDLHLNLSITAEQTEASVICQDQWKPIFDFLYLMPNEMQSMSTDIPNLVETSLNAGILTTNRTQVKICFSVRSSVSSKKRLIGDKIKALTELLGGTYVEDSDYPAWEYRSDSPLRERMVEVYEAMFHEKPVIEVMHAGLECGLFMEKCPSLDCVSFGPQIDDIHTPKERLSIASTEKIWEYLLILLEKGNL